MEISLLIMQSYVNAEFAQGFIERKHHVRNPSPGN